MRVTPSAIPLAYGSPSPPRASLAAFCGVPPTADIPRVFGEVGGRHVVSVALVDSDVDVEVEIGVG